MCNNSYSHKIRCYQKSLISEEVPYQANLSVNPLMIVSDYIKINMYNQCEKVRISKA